MMQNSSIETLNKDNNGTFNEPEKEEISSGIIERKKVAKS